MSRSQRELYIEQRSFGQYDAIDFFDFCAFSSDKMPEAVFQWKSIILPYVQQKDPAQHKRLLVSWEESKQTRQKYWDTKQKEEKRDAQLDDHIDHIRNDAIEQTQHVSASITRDVGKRLQGSIATVQENRMSEASPPTCVPRGKASLETHLSDLEVCPPYNNTSTTSPISPPHTSTVTGQGSSTLETSPATSSSSTSAPSTSYEESADPSESEQLLDCDREELLRSVEESSRHLCDWKVDDACLACLFTNYRRSCINALVAREIIKTDIADLMAVIGVFAPTLPTTRMLEVFSQRQLEKALGPKPELPEIDIDDAKIMKAVRLYLNDRGDEAEMPSMAGNKKLRIMLETLLEYLPLDEDRTISECTFTVKYVASIIQAYMDGDGITCDFPNTNSTTQKQQNLRADRPDIRAMLSGREVLWGEITGPTQTGNKAKNLWDTFKLVRFGKSFIADGNDHAPLVQVIGSHGTYMRVFIKVRGVMVLEQVGTFTVPTSKAMVPSLVATLPTLELLKEVVFRFTVA
ncbi:hypothetical protein KI688_011923 [Linnemannia hyalina]|uniref:Uncharacterized protein n=1 Tax=Linnemannia hyalina TaxID=64524 RepID=A0A9P7XU33_9FUNG|nr:hypothetical protein KI688_011923 [Linnemannia hyalina]